MTLQAEKKTRRGGGGESTWSPGRVASSARRGAARRYRRPWGWGGGGRSGHDGGCREAACLSAGAAFPPAGNKARFLLIHSYGGRVSPTNPPAPRGVLPAARPVCASPAAPGRERSGDREARVVPGQGAQRGPVWAVAPCAKQNVTVTDNNDAFLVFYVREATCLRLHVGWPLRGPFRAPPPAPSLNHK